MRWDDIITREHYLHSASMMGEQLRYVAEVDDQWIGLLGWSAATLSSASRRKWIGWNIAQERQRLHLIAQNARFLIRGDDRVPNLASRILGLGTSTLRRDWQRTYAHDLLVAETFVDAQRYQGTCYRAAGWCEIGSTRGNRRERVGFSAHGERRLLLMKELVPGGRAALCVDQHPEARGAFLTLQEIALAGSDGLLAHLRAHVPDPRSRRGRSFQFISVLGIVAAGTLTGRRTVEQIGIWAGRLDQQTLEHFCCPRGADGRWKPPCANSLRYLIKGIDPQIFEQAVTSWLQKRGMLGPVSGVSTGRGVQAPLGPHARGICAGPDNGLATTAPLGRPESQQWLPLQHSR